MMKKTTAAARKAFCGKVEKKLGKKVCPEQMREVQECGLNEETIAAILADDENAFG